MPSVFVLLFVFVLLCGVAGADDAASPYRKGELLHADDFDGGLDHWVVEAERGGKVEASEGRLVVDVPGGCTVWFRTPVEGPVMIEYEATILDEGGPNDRVSDLNCFWMARDARSPDDLFATRRSGAFAEYNPLRGYYVGLGGNSNTTTRFRRYIGDPELRPLLPEHDLRQPEHLLTGNRTQRVRLVAFHGLIEYWRDDRRLFQVHDPEPYTSGWFGFRTVTSRIAYRHFRIWRLEPVLD